MKQTYFIDSENVNDLWVNLLDTTDEKAELVVFYTKGSPHMSYANLRRLKESDREVAFVKCYEGTNALDFQLVTELGYRLGTMEDDDAEMILVTNDNGFEAAVNYWKDRGYHVRRINGQACAKMQRETPVTDQTTVSETKNIQPEDMITETKPVTPEIVPETNPMMSDEDAIPESPMADDLRSADAGIPSSTTGTPENAEEELPLPDFPQEEMDTLIRCLGKKKLGELYNALIAIYGDRGKDYYAVIKPKSYKVEPQAWKLSEKFERYTAIVFGRSDEDEPKGFADFLYDSREKMKNLNSLRAALTKEYGKDKGSVYYTVIKPHVKWMALMN